MLFFTVYSQRYNAVQNNLPCWPASIRGNSAKSITSLHTPFVTEALKSMENRFENKTSTLIDDDISVTYVTLGA